MPPGRRSMTDSKFQRQMPSRTNHAATLSVCAHAEHVYIMNGSHSHLVRQVDWFAKRLGGGAASFSKIRERQALLKTIENSYIVKWTS